ncbi:MAG TPA: GlxA family transcriptional regulator [Gammaproteobacteria bacterium]|nr:GlxA family transcriptional regulator [Gammaproteobacteria bacterium]
MTRQSDDDAPATFAFVLVPRFSMLALSCAIDALRAANVVGGRTLYRWELATPGGGTVEASSGVTLGAKALEETDVASAVAVCGGAHSHDWLPPGLARWLKAQSRNGALVGALSDGSFVLAESGLFQGVRSTIHWLCLDAYRERFPQLDIRASVFEIDRHRFSCAGGTAALDMFLTLIQRQHGDELAVAVADNYIHDRIRSPDYAQHLSAYYHLVRRSPALAAAVREMEAHIEDPSPISVLARKVGISQRQLARLFERYLSRSASDHYMALRLAHARRLLAQTTMPVSAVAMATGFASAAHLATRFRKSHGVSPLQYRQSVL